MTHDGAAVTSILELNFKNKVTALPRLHPAMEVHELDGVTYCDSTTGSDTFNTACGGKFDRDNGPRTAQAIRSFYRDLKANMAWWVGPSSDPKERDAILTDAGFAQNETEVGMTARAHELKFDTSELPSGLQVRQVQTARDMEDFGRVLASVFSPPDADAVNFYKMVASSLNVAALPFRQFVGYVDGTPAAIGSAFLDRELAGIYDICTDPRFRKRGLGSAMTRTAIQAAVRENYDLIGLQASADGLNIYKEIGFKECGEFTIYGIVA